MFLEEGSDLYVCELPGEAEKCQLTDLTVGGFGESADVLGVLGASEAGDYVYFVANGVLSPAAWSAGARPGDCGGGRIAAETCSLYVAHYDSSAHTWEEPRFIATLSGDDEHDWLADNGGELERLSSRVSPDGRFLAFMSDRSLTGYDNRDANPLAHEARDRRCSSTTLRKIAWHAHRATRAARARMASLTPKMRAKASGCSSIARKRGRDAGWPEASQAGRRSPR